MQTYYTADELTAMTDDQLRDARAALQKHRRETDARGTAYRCMVMVDNIKAEQKRRKTKAPG